MDVVERDGLAVVASGPQEVAVHKIDAATGALLETIPIPGAEGAATAVAEGVEGIWVVGCGLGGGNVGRVSETPLGGTTALDRLEIFSGRTRTSSSGTNRTSRRTRTSPWARAVSG